MSLEYGPDLSENMLFDLKKEFETIKDHIVGNDEFYKILNKARDFSETEPILNEADKEWLKNLISDLEEVISPAPNQENMNLAKEGKIKVRPVSGWRE